MSSLWGFPLLVAAGEPGARCARSPREEAHSAQAGSGLRAQEANPRFRPESHPLPARPYVPPVLWGCAALAAAGAALLNAGWERYCAGVGEGAVPLRVPQGALGWACALAPLLGAAALFALAMGVVSVRTGGRVGAGSPRGRYLAAALRWAAAGALIGCVGTCFQLAGQSAEAIRLREMPLSACVLVIEGDPVQGSFGASVDAALWRDGRKAGSVRLSANKTFPRGSRVVAVGSFEGLEADEWGRALFMRGVMAQARVASVRSVDRPAQPVYALREAVLDGIDPEASPERALVAGTVCGYASALNADPVSDAFALTGLSHLVAVSGSHLALVAALVAGVLERAGTPRGLRCALIGGLMGLYVVFSGGAPSAVRSFLMVTAGSATALGGRRAHALSGLGVTAFVLMGLRPGLVYDVGFELSVMSVLFILVFGRYLACLLARMGLPDALAELLALTLSAQWATLPITMEVFGQVSLVAPIANLLAEPPMTALLATGLVAAPVAAAIPALGLALNVPLACARLSIFVAQLMAGIPYAAVAVEPPAGASVLLWGAAAVAYLLWGDPRRSRLLAGIALAAVGVCCWALAARFAAPPRVTVLDVGQGDAILIRDGPAAVLVDTGEGDAVCGALARNGVFALDAVIITHWDSDHAGGLDDLAQTVPVGAVYAAAGAAEHAPDNAAKVAARTEPGTVDELAAGDCVTVGRFTCRVLWPREPVDGEDNEDSLVLSVTFEHGADRLSVLLTGDAERSCTAQIAQEAGDIDVLKLAHHGSAESVDGALLDALRPEAAVASAGAGNRYGHPTAACRAAVEAAGALFLCTIDCGDIAFAPGASGPAISYSGPRG